MKPIQQWMLKKRVRHCDRCGHVQQVEPKRVNDPVPCEACSAVIPPPSR